MAAVVISIHEFDLHLQLEQSILPEKFQLSTPLPKTRLILLLLASTSGRLLGVTDKERGSGGHLFLFSFWYLRKASRIKQPTSLSQISVRNESIKIKHMRN